MREYTRMFHESFCSKIAKRANRKVATVRLRDDQAVNDALLDSLCKLEAQHDFTLTLSVKGKASLPSFVIIRGFELASLKPKILEDARRALVVFDLLV